MPMLIWYDATKFKPDYNVTVLGHYHCSKCARNESHAHTCLEMPINPGNFGTCSYVKGDPTHPHPRFHEDYWTVNRITHWAYIPIPVFNESGEQVADIYKPRII